MKLKYYLRGLGIGILVTAAILTIVYHTKGSMSDSQIMKRAAQLGMVMASTEDDTLFAQTTQVDTTIEETGTISVEETTTVVETTEAVTEASTEKPTEAPTEAPTEPAAAEAVLTISPGMYSESVSAELVRLGIITNQKEFNSYLVNNGYAECIQTGDFKIKADMSYDEIARIITK
ncbi:tolA domain protein [Butyrivibrio sp. CAG:318]|jgi:hypothetical protein|nr:tolA domain protein [Butyrivibrio sp. CAG:318]